MFLTKKGQSATELVILITIILGVLVSIGTYFKRGIQGRWKVAVDELGDQYDPRAANQDMTHRIIANGETIITTVDAPGGVWTIRTDNTDSTEIKSGFIRVDAF